MQNSACILSKNAVLLLLWVTKRSGGVYPKGTLRRGQSPANNKELINVIVLFPALRGADFVKVFALRVCFAGGQNHHK